MVRIGLVFWFLAALRLGGHGEDIQARISRALGPEDGRRASVLFQQKRFTDIEPLLAPTHEGWSLRGALEFLAGRMEGAIKCFDEARRLRPLREADRFTLTMAWVQLERPDKARAELTELADAYPQKSLYRYWLGKLDFSERRYAEAVEKLKEAARLDGTSARIWDSLGLAYDMQGQSDDALRAFETGAKTNRGQARPSPWPPHDLGALLLRTGDMKGAEAAFREALGYDPHMQEAHYHLGRALEKVGSNEEAAREYIKSMEEGRGSSDVCYSLAMLYRKMSRAQEAEAMFTEWRRRRDARQ